MNTTTFKLCATCAEIVSQGYTDSIDCAEEHQKRCNAIDKELLPANHYWLESVECIDTEWHTECECCRALAVDRVATAMQSAEYRLDISIVKAARLHSADIVEQCDYVRDMALTTAQADACEDYIRDGVNATEER